MTRRGVDVLGLVETIAVEDSRRARILLDSTGLTHQRVVTLHDHNEQAVSETLAARLAGGSDVALISDAGTPLLSDPGFDLVRRARALGVPVVPVPGPSAITAALSVCPIPSRRFFFEGFLPARAEQRQRRLAELARLGETLVFFEAPHRLIATLYDLCAVAGDDRQLFLGREMTKRHEEYLSGTALEIRDVMAARGQIRGELVCVVAADPEATLAGDAERVMDVLSDELSPSAAARIGARLTGAPRKELYALARSREASESPRSTARGRKRQRGE